MKKLINNQKHVTRQALAYVADIAREEAESNMRNHYDTATFTNIDRGDREGEHANS